MTKFTLTNLNEMQLNKAACERVLHLMRHGSFEPMHGKFWELLGVSGTFYDDDLNTSCGKHQFRDMVVM